MIILFLLSFLLKPDTPPQYVNWYCYETVVRIVQHEVGDTNSPEVYRFVAEQVYRDSRQMGCQNLTQWRWKIGKVKAIYPKVELAVTRVYGDTLKYPKCQFVGNLNDIKVWRSYGYSVKVDYRFEVRGFVVVGANCTKVP